MQPPEPPPHVAAAFAAAPPEVAAPLRAARSHIFASAAETPAIGPLTETLKWGQPAYLTEKTRAGSTLRLGTSAAARHVPCLFFTCHTALLEEFRTLFPEATCFIGNRAIRLAPGLPPTPLLRLCITRALTYRLRRA